MPHLESLILHSVQGVNGGSFGLGYQHSLMYSGSLQGLTESVSQVL